jgi:hypothetical protein
MNIKKFYKEIPKMPFVALIFYLVTYLLWSTNLIPPPSQALVFLENLYYSYGNFGLFLASFLEGIIYVGLYFPGCSIIALAVFLSNGSFASFLMISVLVAFALTLTSIINYWAGRYVISKGNKHERLLEDSKKATKGLIASMAHPNLMSFYFFNAGIEKQRFGKVLYVPLIIIPYGIILSYIMYPFAGPIKDNIDSPYVFLTLIAIWLAFAFIMDHKRKVKQLLHA